MYVRLICCFFISPPIDIILIFVVLPTALLPSSIVGLASYGLGLVGPATQNDTVAGVMIAISFLTSVALYLTLPKLLLKLEWNDSLKVGAVWMGLMFAVGFFVGIIMGLIAAIFFMGQMGSFV